MLNLFGKFVGVVITIRVYANQVLRVLNKEIMAREGLDIREPSYTAGENVNWCSQYEKHYGSSF